jgi:hypothetical protein
MNSLRHGVRARAIVVRTEVYADEKRESKLGYLAKSKNAPIAPSSAPPTPSAAPGPVYVMSAKPPTPSRPDSVTFRANGGIDTQTGQPDSPAAV